MPNSLDKIVYRTIHRSELSVEAIADEAGCSPELLYKAANPNDAKVDFKLPWLLPIMRVTNDYSILQHLAFRSGHVLVRIPRVRRMKPEEIAEHQAIAADYIKALVAYFKNETTKEEALEAIGKMLEAAAQARKRVSEDSAQGELFEG